MRNILKIPLKIVDLQRHLQQKKVSTNQILFFLNHDLMLFNDVGRSNTPTEHYFFKTDQKQLTLSFKVLNYRL